MEASLLVEGKWLRCSLQAMIPVWFVTARHISLGVSGGMFDPKVHFAAFLSYKLMPGVTLLKAAELSRENELLLP